MGTLAKYDLAQMRRIHRLRSFVETGTAQGDGAELARLAGFDPIHTVEVVPEIAAAARYRFQAHPQVQVWEGSSAYCLPMILRELPPEPALFWLDAHFPGAHHDGNYAREEDAAVRLPLQEEIEIIRRWRPHARDVLLIDDARLYVPGPYAAGDLPEDWAPLLGIPRGPDGLQFVRWAYAKTHGIVINYDDQGYVMVFPRMTRRELEENAT